MRCLPKTSRVWKEAPSAGRSWCKDFMQNPKLEVELAGSELMLRWSQVFPSAPARYDRQWKNFGMPHIHYRRWSTTTSCVQTIKMYDHLCAILEQESGSCRMFATSQRCGASDNCRAAGRFWSRQTAAAACLHLPAVCGFREVLELKSTSWK